MRARLRGPGGASTISLADDATVGDLIAQITEKTSLSSFDIKYGYPPKPLLLKQSETSRLLKDLDVKLDGEQLTISQKEEPVGQQTNQSYTNDGTTPERRQGAALSSAPASVHKGEQERAAGPVSLQRKGMADDVPELPLPERGSTLVLRVMPDDNSCLFRALATAVLPGDDLTMPELRSLVASTIQSEPETYTKVVLEKSPDDYCRWIQSPDSWGGAIEMGILAQYFDIEICSIDVQSLRVDRFNEGKRSRCILVYSGIHYDTIVQSPSEPPHTHADSPPEFDKRVWDSSDDEILIKAQDLCRMLQEKHYYTDTGGMAIKCQVCGTIVHGEIAASAHAQETGHYDMAEVPT